MRIFVLALLCAALISCQTNSARNKEQAGLYLQIGTSNLMQGNIPQAISALMDAEKLAPDDPAIKNNLGLAYFMRERYDLAEQKLRQALRLKGDFSDARNNLARVMIELQKPQEALKEALRVTKDLTYGSPEKPWLNAGMAYFQMGQWKEARAAMQKSIEYQRENCLAQSYLGRTYYEEGNYQRATEILDQAIQSCMKSQIDEPHYYSALSYFQLGQKAKSIARFNEVIKLYPNGKYIDKSKSMLETIKR